MFKEGNLVCLTTEDGSGEVMRVLEESDFDGTTHVAIGNDDDDQYLDTNDLELVAQSVLEQPSIPQVMNVNKMSDLALCDEINKYIVAVISSLRNDGYDEKVKVEIDCHHYRGESAEINYRVTLAYNDPITTDNLGKSAHIALSRHFENEAMKVKAIPFYVDKEATE